MKFIINFGQTSIIQEYTSLEQAIDTTKDNLRIAFKINKKPAKVSIQSMHGKVLRNISIDAKGSVITAN